MKCKGAGSSIELQRFGFELGIGCQDSGHSNGHQGSMPYWFFIHGSSSMAPVDSVRLRQGMEYSGDPL